jgi:hypothetical protein
MKTVIIDYEYWLLAMWEHYGEKIHVFAPIFNDFLEAISQQGIDIKIIAPEVVNEQYKLLNMKTILGNAKNQYGEIISYSQESRTKLIQHFKNQDSVWLTAAHHKAVLGIKTHFELDVDKLQRCGDYKNKAVSALVNDASQKQQEGQAPFTKLFVTAMIGLGFFTPTKSNNTELNNGNYQLNVK